MESSNDICSLFDSYLPTNESFSHEITWRMFSTKLRSSAKKNQIKRSSDVGVMQFSNQETFSSCEFGPYGSSSPHLDPYREGTTWFKLNLGFQSISVLEVSFAFSDHIQHPAKVILPDLGCIKSSVVTKNVIRISD
ncbi:hypothetical protein F2Q69_00055456 [Brassica cretica]|uniref:Uncharacterized protein n=1 Tax=Brassica cretica TaxID=69181 RepID=A0A8S9N2C4_BRACR|nr:hypothetical protein F2Q69_00055456 [Brassica cretica]